MKNLTQKMAQGKMKVKTNKPKGTKETNRKHHQVKKQKKFQKKGQISIAPKSKSLLSGHNLKMALTKGINKKNEATALSMAKAKGTTLYMNKKSGGETEGKK